MKNSFYESPEWPVSYGAILGLKSVLRDDKKIHTTILNTCDEEQLEFLLKKMVDWDDIPLVPTFRKMIERKIIELRGQN